MSRRLQILQWTPLGEVELDQFLGPDGPALEIPFEDAGFRVVGETAGTSDLF